ncbi:hypothetical protein OUZ56_007242 [Daphnia magna]|uniref:Uncharacterized protein n=1 Tax=Daphnia magna TaxID=35525 RepID=A0ABQ9YY13_9CRUS|nr:hypothetical protein OUZ56_007242 [Daphnia magna]
MLWKLPSGGILNGIIRHFGVSLRITWPIIDDSNENKHTRKTGIYLVQVSAVFELITSSCRESPEERRSIVDIDNKERIKTSAKRQQTSFHYHYGYVSSK